MTNILVKVQVRHIAIVIFNNILNIFFRNEANHNQLQNGGLTTYDTVAV